MKTEELKEQEDLLLRYIDEAYPSGNISKLYLEVKDSLIDKTVQITEERIVEEIEKIDFASNGETWIFDGTPKEEEMYVKGFTDFKTQALSLITNNNDINNNKE